MGNRLRLVFLTGADANLLRLEVETTAIGTCPAAEFFSIPMPPRIGVQASVRLRPILPQQRVVVVLHRFARAGAGRCRRMTAAGHRRPDKKPTQPRSTPRHQGVLRGINTGSYCPG